MFKVTPNPPNRPDSNNPDDNAESSLDPNTTAHIKATPRTPSTLFTVNPEVSTEDLMAYLVETLASVDVMVHHLVYLLEGGARQALLGISQSVMLAEITANRMLDRIDPP